MQINFIDTQELEDLLDDSKTLQIIDSGNQRIYVLEYTGQDIFAIETGTEKITVIYPCASFDAESGGSVHDHARATLDNETADAVA